MTGIVGFSYTNEGEAYDKTSDSKRQAVARLAKMQGSLHHSDQYVDDPIHLFRGVAGTRTSAGIVQPIVQPAEHGNMRVWLEGEILNRADLWRTIDPIADSAAIQEFSDADLLARLVAFHGDWAFLEDLSGVFSAVVFQPSENQLHFITDRHGLEFLYYTQIDGDQIYWSSETKAFLACEGFRPVIHEASLESFFKKGHLSDDQTWFRNVKLLPPASRWTWSLNSHRFVEQVQYWGWENIEPIHAKADYRELAIESARLFKQAIVRCDDRTNNRIGVLLSGGLDSRAALAAIDAGPEGQIPTLTYGLPSSSDLKIAKQVAELQDSKHHFFPIDDDNWFLNRSDYVWYTDGHLDWQHMNHAVCAPNIHGLFDVNLSGYLGDATIGGSYLTKSDGGEFSRIRDRGRRFIAHGVQVGKVFTHERLPFFDNAFLMHCMRIPAAIRRDSRYYFWMLQCLLPNSLHPIPWQQTGLSIWKSPQSHRFAALRARAGGRLRRVAGMPPGANQYTNHGRWLKLPSGDEILGKTIFANDSPSADIVSSSVASQLALVRKKSKLAPSDVDCVTRSLTLDLILRRIHGESPLT